ncbi:(2Fe-2S) ferredoxin domain-containing protein [Nannocystis pusilla]|uniref:(2Fe-2S) ferredoxin domain-containing protein n=1 Tax=Nannocystis pusilla TaxID=889268 RepID=A0A9X3EZB0_9BACT|nr:(2Fe-2S) ferredoxin domain-containing protein [Nannocystis pusilla]MCY1012320.1 (2Fe-2S) ferredoxin domain-containing protein [Nannocystis pusilla]
MKQPSLVFVCQNLRDPDAIQGSCMRRGSKDVLERLKQLRVELGLKTQLRVMGCTCLGPCESGVTVLVVDDKGGATYYGRMDVATADALMHEHVLAGEPGEALRRHRLPKDNLLNLSALAGHEDPDAQAAEEKKAS